MAKLNEMTDSEQIQDRLEFLYVNVCDTDNFRELFEFERDQMLYHNHTPSQNDPHNIYAIRNMAVLEFIQRYLDIGRIVKQQKTVEKDPAKD